MQWTGNWHRKTWPRRLFTILRATHASCIDADAVLALQFWKNFLIKNSTNVKLMRNSITVSGTLQIKEYWQSLQFLTKNTKRLWLMLLIIKQDIPISEKLKITSSWYKTKAKATTGVKNVASYIPWLYTTWGQMVASNMICCVLVLMTTTIT